MPAQLQRGPHCRRGDERAGSDKSGAEEAYHADHGAYRAAGVATGFYPVEFVDNGEQQSGGEIGRGDKQKLFARAENEGADKRQGVSHGGEDECEPALAVASLRFEPGHEKLYRIGQSRSQHLKEENGGEEPRRGEVPAAAHKAADEQQADKNRRNGKDAYCFCDFFRSLHDLICEDIAVTLPAERLGLCGSIMLHVGEKIKAYCRAAGFDEECRTKNQIRS